MIQIAILGLGLLLVHDSWLKVHGHIRFMINGS